MAKPSANHRVWRVFPRTPGVCVPARLVVGGENKTGCLGVCDAVEGNTRAGAQHNEIKTGETALQEVDFAEGQKAIRCDHPSSAHRPSVHGGDQCGHKGISKPPQ